MLLVLTPQAFTAVIEQRHLQGWDDHVLCGGRIGVLLTSLVLDYSLEQLATSISGWKLFRTFMVRRIFRLYPFNIFSTGSPFGSAAGFFEMSRSGCSG